jgi:3-deoxy-D-manno-octulosonate 8-phosphate phosphatase KdsC-like HAD superfamily phosphatase
VSYDNGEKYCIVVGQTIPAATTLNAPVVAVVGDGTTQFPLITRCGAPVVSQQISTRIKYPVCVTTSSTGGTLRVLRCLPEVEVFTLNSLNDAGGGA